MAIGQFPNFDMSYFEEGSSLVVELNAMLNVIKPAAVTVVQLWSLLSGFLDSENQRLTLVKFGDCVPDKESLRKAKERLDQKNRLMPRIEEFLSLRVEDISNRELEHFIEHHEDFIAEYLDDKEREALNKKLADAKTYHENFLPADIRRQMARKALHHAAVASVGRWGSVRASVDLHYGEGELAERLLELQHANEEAKEAGVNEAEMSLAKKLEKEISNALVDKTKRGRGEFVSHQRRRDARLGTYAALTDQWTEEEPAPPPPAGRGKRRGSCTTGSRRSTYDRPRGLDIEASAPSPSMAIPVSLTKVSAQGASPRAPGKAGATPQGAAPREGTPRAGTPRAGTPRAATPTATPRGARTATTATPRLATPSATPRAAMGRRGSTTPQPLGEGSSATPRAAMGRRGSTTPQRPPKR